jgi:hypothetical protein
MKLLATACTAALLTCASVSAAPIQLVKNGSFEANGVASGSWTVRSSLQDWTVGALGAEVRNNVAGAASLGSNYLELDSTGNSWISQSIATAAGALYTISFDYSPREFVTSGSNGIEVLWGGKSYGIFTGTGGSGNQWHKYSFSGIGASASTVLQFRAVGTSDGVGGSLDNVSVTADVPEPGSLAIIGLGLAMLGLTLRRQRG